MFWIVFAIVNLIGLIWLISTCCDPMDDSQFGSCKGIVVFCIVALFSCIDLMMLLAKFVL
jgi:hypothetical protein